MTEINLGSVYTYITNEYSWLKPVVAGRLVDAGTKGESPVGWGEQNFITVSVYAGLASTCFSGPELEKCAKGGTLRKLVDARMWDVAHSAWFHLSEKLGKDEA